MHEINDFLSYLLAERGYSQLTVDTYKESLTSFLLFLHSLDKELTWQNIDSDVIRRWMTTEMQRKRNSRTIAKKLAAVRSFFKYMLRMKRIDHDPTRLIHNPKIHASLPTFLRQNEIDYLFDNVTFPDTEEGLRDRTILLTFYHTGIRVSELTGLNIESVILEKNELSVIGKRNKQRIVPFGQELGDYLHEFIRQRLLSNASISSPLFLNSRGLRITPPQIRNIVKKYLSLVTTQKKKSPHVFRHTFATQMLNNGADLEAIKQLLGHKSITTTEIYTHTTFADLKKEYELAHPRA